MTEDFDPTSIEEHDRRVLSEAPVMAGFAVYAVGHPGPWGAVREMRAASASHVLRQPGDRGAATDLTLLLSKEINSRGVQFELQDRLDVDDAHLAESAMAELAEAAAAAQRVLPPDVFDGYVSWVVDAARCVAETARDKGDSVAVSPAESEMLDRIEAALRAPR